MIFKLIIINENEYLMKLKKIIPIYSTNEFFKIFSL